MGCMLNTDVRMIPGNVMLCNHVMSRRVASCNGRAMTMTMITAIALDLAMRMTMTVTLRNPDHIHSLHDSKHKTVLLPARGHLRFEKLLIRSGVQPTGAPMKCHRIGLGLPFAMEMPTCPLRVILGANRSALRPTGLIPDTDVQRMGRGTCEGTWDGEPRDHETCYWNVVPHTLC